MTLAQDFRYALRLFAKSPGFASLVVLMLGVGIGANTAVFSIVNGVLLRPLSYHHPDRLVVIWAKIKNQANLAKIFNSYEDFKELRDHSRSFDNLAALTWATGDTTLTGRGPARGVLAIPASVDFFALLGVAPALGRTFQADDLSRGCTVVLSHSFWKDLGVARDIVGQTLLLDRKACTVIGVMPAGFAFYPEQTSLWTLITPDFRPNWDTFLVGIFGRLKPGVSISSAQTEASVLQERLHRRDKRERDTVPVIYPLHEEFTWLSGRNLRLSLMVLFGAVSLVLLIACLNVASLLLGHSISRQRELSMRAAMGAGPARLVRQLMTEGLLLSAFGAGLGVVIAIGAVRWFRALRPVELPPGADVTIHSGALLFAAALGVLTTLLFGLAPAWRASRVDLNDVLKAAARGTSAGWLGAGLTKGLVVAQVTLSLLLLLGADLLIQSVLRLRAAPLGVRTDNVATMRVSLPKDRYLEAAQQREYFRELLDRTRSLASVQAAALTSHVPVVNGIGNNSLSIEGRPSEASSLQFDVGVQTISPEYFGALGVPLREGRWFDGRDREDSPQVAVINQALAREYFPNGNALGARIRVGGVDDGARPWLVVVGVVGTEKRTIVYQEMNYIEMPVLFRPFAQNPSKEMVLVIRARDGLAALAAGRREANTIDADVVAGDLMTLEARISKFLAYPRFRAIVLGMFAVLAMLLAAAGLYAVIAQSVAFRTQEIGVRMALGANPADVLSMVVRQGLSLGTAGAAIGILAALALGRYLSSLLYGVKPTDAAALAAVSLILLTVTIAAAYIPARRASRVDPVIALRYE
jgi:putative ABC transport system permease protein